MTVKERFLNYISYWTTSDENSNSTPSTKRQFDLARVLQKELEQLGFSHIKLDEHCYVYGLLPATPGYETKQAIGFIAHMDTAPDYSGYQVKPQIIESYDGKDILLRGSGESIRVADFPHLADLKGRTLITTDGTTLLGADDKAGIAEILTAMEEIIHEHIPHGDLWVGFTPDEEIGAGADHFDLDSFRADYAYTLDGDYEGEIAYENFNAASAEFTIHGISVHPGSAKNIMVNASAIACELQQMLPKEQTPEQTADREGFIHLHNMQGDVSQAHLSYIVRDHDANRFQEKKLLLQATADYLNQKYGKNTVQLSLTDSYSNMLEVIEQNFFIIEAARQAIQSTGLTAISTPVRGGTDGARLSFMGLPCPNLGTGGHAYHGPYEHISLEGMNTAIQIIKEIVRHPFEREM